MRYQIVRRYSGTEAVCGEEIVTTVNINIKTVLISPKRGIIDVLVISENSAFFLRLLRKLIHFFILHRKTLIEIKLNFALLNFRRFSDIVSSRNLRMLSFSEFIFFKSNIRKDDMIKIYNHTFCVQNNLNLPNAK